MRVLPNNPDGESGIESFGVTYGVTYPIHTGGGWYELSNGKKVQGKENAEAVEEELGE